MTKATLLSLAGICCIALSGCSLVGQKDLEPLTARIAALEQNPMVAGGNQRFDDINTKFAALKKDTEKDDAALRNEIKAAEEKSATFTGGVEASLKTKLDVLGTQLLAVQETAKKALDTATLAQDIAAKSKTSVAEYQKETQSLHKGYTKTIEDTQKAFDTRLAGTETSFGVKVANLETQVKGMQSETVATVNRELKKALDSMQTSHTVLLGRLSECKTEIEKTRSINDGFKKVLEDALAEMKILLKGNTAEVDEKCKTVSLQYTGLNAKFDDVKKTVEKYGEQLNRMRTALSSILIEIPKGNESTPAGKGSP